MSFLHHRRSFLSTSATLAAGLALKPLRAAAPKDDATMSLGTNHLAGELHRELGASAGNVFFSPFSIATALAMTAAGARGDTLAQMRKVLHMAEGNDGGLGQVLKAVQGQPGEKRPYDLSTANAIWAQTGYPWQPAYLQTVRQQFSADVKDINFAADPEAARQAINAWVEKETREKIKDLLAQGTIMALTRMVLVNAVYFKGSWVDPFRKEATKDAPFTLAGGGQKTVPLMRRTGRYQYAESDGLQRLALPYAGNQLSMVVVLPRKPDGLATLQQKDVAPLFDMPAGGRSTQVELSLPKFKVEAPYNLNAPLQKLGMTDAFDDRKADFSGMVTNMPEGKLVITDVVHKAFVDVNEEGTEAAAATGVVIGVRSAIPAEPVVFRADRPFLFAIRHNSTGAILFMGRYETPA